MQTKEIVELLKNKKVLKTTGGVTGIIILIKVLDIAICNIIETGNRNNVKCFQCGRTKDGFCGINVEYNS